MQYHCLVYFDPRVAFADTPEAEAINAEVGPSMEEMRARGELVAAYPLSLPSEAITVSSREGRTSTTDGPFIESKEMLGGLVVIEARDLNDAIRIAAAIPHARTGHVEVRPAIDFSRPRPKF